MNSREKIAHALRNIRSLPTLPDVAVRLLEMGESPTASMRDLARWIEKDTALAARVLKLVNSSFFGVAREVSSVRHALMILGMAHLRNLVLSSAVSNLFDREGQVGGFSRREFWKHCVAVAGAARTIAALRGIMDPETAFTAGLIHDIGKLVMDRYLHEDFVKVVARLEDPDLTMTAAEIEVLGVHHGEIGHHLVAYWNLPEVLCMAVGFHHEPEMAPQHSSAAALVGLADALVRQLRIGSGGGADHPLSEHALALCGLSLPQFEDMQRDLEEELEEQVDVLAETE
ncbi:MAG: HDOD domain-containing protein [bacterium]|nr:HDOD domain-containing protein [bacterium]